MGSPETCPTCGSDDVLDRRMAPWALDLSDEMNPKTITKLCRNAWHDTPTPPAPADDAGCIIVKSPRPCPDCDGTGWLAGDPCPLCSGLAPGEREDARLKHQRAVEKARRADDASGADCRVVDANGKPFGPMLASMLHEAEESVVDHPDFNERCRLSALIAQAAAYIDAVVEGRGPLPAHDDAVEEARSKVVEAAVAWCAPNADDGMTDMLLDAVNKYAALRREKGGDK